MQYVEEGEKAYEHNTLPVIIITKSHQLPFNPCWNVCVLHNLPPNTNHITRHHLELAYQFVMSSRYSPDINVRWFPFNFPFLSRNPSGGTFLKLSCGVIFIMCSHTFSLFWLKDICDCQNISIKLPCVPFVWKSL